MEPRKGNHQTPLLLLLFEEAFWSRSTSCARWAQFPLLVFVQIQILRFELFTLPRHRCQCTTLLCQCTISRGTIFKKGLAILFFLRTLCDFKILLQISSNNIKRLLWLIRFQVDIANLSKQKTPSVNLLDLIPSFIGFSYFRWILQKENTNPFLISINDWRPLSTFPLGNRTDPNHQDLSL